MKRPEARLTIAAVTLILGFLVVLQIRAQGAGSELSGRSAQELTLLVANVNDRNDQLRTEVATLERELGALQASKARGESSLDELGADLRRLRAWTGLERVAGTGVQITIAGSIDAGGVMELVNELRNAGAEALAIDGIRVVAATIAAGPAGGMSVEDTALPSTFTIDAIGSPETLTGSLKRAGGIVAQLGATYPGATITVTPVERVELPATTRDPRPAHGTPVL